MKGIKQKAPPVHELRMELRGWDGTLLVWWESKPLGMRRDGHTRWLAWRGQDHRWVRATPAEEAVFWQMTRMWAAASGFLAREGNEDG